MANTIIQLKYSNATSVPPTLNISEPAYSNVSNKLWINDGANIVAIGGKYYIDLIDAATANNTANTIVRRSANSDISANVISGTVIMQNTYNILSHANNAYAAANNAYNSGGVIAGGYANSAYLQANAAFVQANTSANNASSASSYANGAFAAANTKFNISGGSITGYANVASNVSVGTYLDIIDIDTNNPTHKEARLFYDGNQKALSYYNENSTVTLQIGQEVLVRVWNNTGSSITDGKAVYISGTSSANGFPSVALASSASQDTSEVIGLTTTTIPAGGYGYVTQAGKVNGLNTSLIAEGSELYLSSTSPGDYSTTVQPAPAIPLVIGYVARSDLTNGSILMNIHIMEGENKTTGAVLFAYNGAIYEDPANFFYDRANNRLGIGTNAPTANLHVAGDGLFTGNVIISGNLLVSNAQSITTSELFVGSNVIVLNANASGSPIANAEIIVNRGSSANAVLRWDEVYDEWVIDEGTGNAGHILSSEKTAETWADYTAFDAYEKLTYPIGATLANSINEHAKAGYAYANTTGLHAIAGYNQANTATNNAASAGSYANSAFLKANTADQRAVTSGAYANAAFVSANTTANNVTSASSYANSAFFSANTAANNATSAGSYANSAFTKANTATTNAATADQRAVTSGAYANSAYLTANTAANNATSAGSYANSAFGVANTASAHATSAYTQANTATTNAATADQRAVTSGAYANAAFGAANTAANNVVIAGSYANSAYATANTKLNSSGGTISGNLSITGNLTVSGNTVIVDTETISVEDSLIKLANNNITDVVDIGFYGQYGSSGTKYTGLIRDASDGTFKLFTNETSDPTGNVVAYSSDNRATLEANFTGGNVSGLFNAIAVSDGGTGVKTLTQNYVVLGAGTNPVTTVGSSTEGHVLTINASGVPTFQHLNGGTF